MDALVVQAEIVQVGAGSHIVRVQLIDPLGSIIDQADRAVVDVSLEEVYGPDVQIQIRQVGGVKTGGGGEGIL